MGKISAKNLCHIFLIIIGTATYLYFYMNSAMNTMDSGFMELKDIHTLNIFLFLIIGMCFSMYVQGKTFIYREKTYTLVPALALIVADTIKILICLSLLYTCLYYSIIFD